MTDVRSMACWGAAGFIGTALLIVAASPAHGQPPVEVIAQKGGMTRVVHFGDLSLATQKGRNTLVRRVGYAVGQVCPDYADGWVIYDVDGCKKFAWKGARPQIRRAFDRALSGSSMTMTSLTITAGAK
jgi:UrcA family protein